MKLAPFTTDVLEYIHEENRFNSVTSCLEGAAHTVRVALGIFAFFSWVVNTVEKQKAWVSGFEMGNSFGKQGIYIAA